MHHRTRIIPQVQDIVYIAVAASHREELFLIGGNIELLKRGSYLEGKSIR